MSNQETIAALATPRGEGGIAVIRLSGPEAVAVADRVFRGRRPLARTPSRRMTRGVIEENGRRIDDVLAVVMRGPESYTGEDVVEIHGHGGLLVCRAVLEAVYRAGARPALPGEFTQRAFLNGKMDLTQAEAVADLVRARTERAMEAARRQLDGAVGDGIRQVAQRLLDLVAEVEARIDFPEDDLPEEDRGRMEREARRIDAELESLEKAAREDQRLREGVVVVIAGRPNVGKSSLFNVLAGRERAIVSEHPGTTRDTVDAEWVCGGIPVRLVDTAGLRESADPVERLGVERSLAAMEDAELVLYVEDATQREESATPDGLRSGLPVIRVVNKIDIISSTEKSGPGTALPVSARTGEGIDRLIDELERRIRGGDFAARRTDEIGVSARHLALLREARTALERGLSLLREGELDRIAADWRYAWERLGEITGETAGEDVLDRIFRRFCIGK